MRKPRTKYCGVYGILQVSTGRIYIGSSVDMTGRFTHHRFMLRRGLHKNHILQQAWKDHLEGDFLFMFLESCSPMDRVDREQVWMDNTDKDLLFNVIKADGTGSTGPSPKGSEAAKNRWAMPGFREKVSPLIKAGMAKTAQ